MWRWMAMVLDEILTKAVQNGASDIHLKVASRPTERINGSLRPIEGFDPLTIEDLKAFTKIIPLKQKNGFETTGDSDYAYAINNVSRFRVNTYTQRGTTAFAFRVIPRLDFDILSIGLPAVVRDLALEKRGLILVTGVTGSGKSTTLAAMIDHINKSDDVNIITLEDPIEFLHNDRRALIAQREISNDTASFAEGLRRALRQDPDVILVGEMRDVETIETAIHAAETGHLVFSTLHTLDALETINRILAMFPPHQQYQIRVQLANVLRAIVSQRLIPTADGKRRVPAVEVMINTAAVKDAITDVNKTENIEDLIIQGRDVYRSQTFDQSLYELCTSGVVTVEEAMNWVKRKDDFKLMIKGITARNYETGGL
jgi:twitching motility protein PilT